MIVLGGVIQASAQEQVTQQVAPATLININKASAEQLQALPGIGAVKARSIVAYRENQPFGAVEEILAVDGIGAATLERIRNQITVD
ncbi:ComEA family DNA-binding protein [Geoalkalibacter halelectricus]|nr:ComEA family DNA-binding protein [Geoalkalibacter halelectricus]MDO3379117.1 ComEA family DNA-binding protein [Geoalkalibacter halelectricus]